MSGILENDLTGQRFGRLTVIKRYGTYHPPRGGSAPQIWLCLCDCGTEVAVRADALRNGNTKSCGCLSRELASKRMKEIWRRARDGRVEGNDG